MGAIDGHQVEIRPSIHLARAAATQGDHGDVAGKVAADTQGLSQRGGRQGPHTTVGQISEGRSHLGCAGDSAHHLHTDAKGLLAMNSPHGVHGRFVTRPRPAQRRLQRGHVLSRGDGLEEILIQQSVERGGAARQGRSQPGREGHDLDHQVEKLGLGQKQGLDLYA